MSVKPQTLIDLFADVSGGADRAMLGQRNAAGTWEMTGSHALRERFWAAALGLRKAGIGSGDRVAIMSPNRVDWIVANWAILHAGASSCRCMQRKRTIRCGTF
jgi:long-chain acyl-CoA synthetase